MLLLSLGVLIREQISIVLLRLDFVFGLLLLFAGKSRLWLPGMRGRLVEQIGVILVTRFIRLTIIVALVSLETLFGVDRWRDKIIWLSLEAELLRLSRSLLELFRIVALS